MSDPPALPPDVAAAPAEARFGKFIRTNRLGKGGMGEVWRAWDVELGRWVALKFLTGGQADLERFRREAQLAGRLDHPHIAKVYEAGEAQGRHYIAMQLVDGVTLRALTDEGEVGRRRLVELIRDAARGVEYAHRQGVIHRDLKPENLMVVDGAGPRPQLYVMDFGLARATQGGSGQSIPGMVLGTPDYMPPEQAQGRPLDGRADVWALGATLYDLIAGLPPFDAGSPMATLHRLLREDAKPLRNRHAQVAPDLETIVMKCLERDADRRYASSAELADDLTRFLDGDAVVAHPPGRWYRLRKWARKNRVAVTATTVALAGIGAAAGLLLPGWLSERAARHVAEANATAQRERIVAALQRREHARAVVAGANSIVEELNALVGTSFATQKQVDALFQEAMARYLGALEIDPSLEVAWLGKGRLHAMTGERAKALEAFDRATAASPRMYAPYVERIRVLANEYESRAHRGIGSSREPAEMSELGAKLEQQISLLRQLGLPADQLAYAEAMHAFGGASYAQAVAGLRAHLQARPADPVAWYMLGHALKHLRELDEAAGALRRSVELNRFSSGPLHMLAAAQLDLKRLEAAKPLIEEYRRRYPDHETGLALEVRRIIIAGQPAKALAYLDELRAGGRASAELELFRANALGDLGRINEAIAVCRALVDADPGHHRAWFAIAQHRLNRNQMELAFEAASGALRAQPGWPQALAVRAMAAASTGRHESASRDIADTLGAGMSSDPMVISMVAQALAIIGRAPEAVALLNAAAAAQPTEATFPQALGVVYFDTKELDKARAALERAIQLEPDDAMALANLGQLLVRAGEVERGSKTLDRAVAINRGFFSPRLARAIALSTRKPKQALADLRWVLTRAPESMAARRELVLVLGLLGHSNESVDAADWVLERAPDDWSVRAWRGQGRYDAGDLDGAQADFEILRDAAPGEAVGWAGLAKVARRRKSVDDAMRLATEAIERPDCDPEAWRVRAWALIHQRKYPEAIADLNVVLERRPHLAEVLLERALLHGTLGKYEAALADYDEVLEHHHPNAMVLGRRAAALAHLGRDAEALAELERAVKLDPDHTAAWMDLGRSRFKAGDPAGAAEAYEEVIKRLPPDHKRSKEAVKRLTGLGR